MREKTTSIIKVLSLNDVGLTGSHQSGMLVPKQEEILSFFPKLNKNVLNPRFLLSFFDETEAVWKFSFIYYNNRMFGGTRNEYRLTRMTEYIKRNNLNAGDAINLKLDEDGKYRITYRRQQQNANHKIKLSEQWKVIRMQ